MIERCKAQGLRVLGKTNTDEFAMGSSTENSAYGPTKNPWDPTRVPGGSGGGSAAAVAAGLAPWALGSDTGGSIKQPAALCGNVGLRPTYGTVSRYGAVAFASSLDQIGPVARNVRDCALLYSIIAGRDPCDSTTVELPDAVALPEGDDLKGVRVGVPTEFNEHEAIEPGVREAVQRAIELCRELGAEVGDCSLPHSRRVRDAVLLPDRSGGGVLESRALRRRALRLPLAERRDRLEMYERTRDEGFGEEPKRRIMIGTYALSAGYYDAYYGQAQKVRTVLAREHAEAFERFDVLVSPTSPTVAFKLGARSAESARDVPQRPAHDPVVHGGPARAERAVRPLRGLAGRPAADRAAVLGEHPLPRSGTRSSRRSASTPCRSGCDDDALRGSGGGLHPCGAARLRRRAARARRLARRARRRREADARGGRARALARARAAAGARGLGDDGRGRGRHRGGRARGEGEARRCP